MQNLKKDNFVWVIHVNRKSERKEVAKLNIDYNDYIEENIYKNYKVLYKSFASYDSKENQFFKKINNIRSNVFCSALIIKENKSVEDDNNPKKLITRILLFSLNEDISLKFPKIINHKYEISKNSFKLF
ncbi:unnamed protein product [Rhizophagus irregularis]|nr:unnamed protein product [Rhizophagus irregularis]CAB5114962.1 unnamed protein product [Rhizophagus irregularis]